MDNFSQKLLNWTCELPGRGLPWAFSSDPYVVWVSEIMLQQTQAATVVPYFDRFLKAFPNVKLLADAPIDDVMKLWSGLGYYSRARNLHAAARIICDRHQGEFPRSFQAILDLPGVGRSTAGAICALAYGMRTPILDGNAKRVYARYFCVDEESESIRNRRLWDIADSQTPENEVQLYTQLIMDLGATVCTPKNPKCSICPLNESCSAYINDLVDVLPRRRTPRVRDIKAVILLVIMNDDGKVVLEQRPPKGIWGNLWCFPEFTGAVENVESWCHDQYRLRIRIGKAWEQFHHDFTHYRLMITPQPARLLDDEREFRETLGLRLVTVADAISMGIPVPVRSTLTRLQNHSQLIDDSLM